jgi:hypothetical protein
MDNESLREALVHLASGKEFRSETARLNDVFDEVESALRSGVSRPAILQTLHARGFTMTLYSFQSALARLRSRRKKTDISVPAQPSTVVRATTKNVSIEKPARSTVVSPVSELPDDWLTCAPKPGLLELLTPEQKIARTKARDAIFDPSPYDSPLPSRNNT